MLKQGPIPGSLWPESLHVLVRPASEEQEVGFPQLFCGEPLESFILVVPGYLVARPFDVAIDYRSLARGYPPEGIHRR
jgi:hypothetical protein